MATTEVVPAGNVGIGCTVCDSVIDVPITAELTRADDGGMYLRLEPDFADLWAHTWTHEHRTAEGAA